MGQEVAQKLFQFLISLLAFILVLPSPVQAVVDPLAVPNNEFGIHLIHPTHDETHPALSLVNSSGGDWGYVTILIESKDRNHDKWQQIFDDLREHHFIPLVRLATQPDGGVWKRPYQGEEQAWADFLDRLNWPTKNRYVIIYNEPNQAHEWGGQVDPLDYALTLDKTITALKTKNEDFFVLNGGFDASAPEKRPELADQVEFMKQMNEEVPNIFQRLDGWVSHSYPNPDFSGSPTDSGRGTVRTFLWELNLLKELNVKKNLPVFITETGWKHAEGLIYSPGYPSSETVADYFKAAFTNTWNNNQIAAVTPFLLNYEESPFDHFSFKKHLSDENEKPFYPHYYLLQDIQKVAGQPAQIRSAELVKGEIYPSIVAGESYAISLTFKNTGQTIWNDASVVKLIPLQARQELGLIAEPPAFSQKVEPGKEVSFQIKLKAPSGGKYKVVLNLFDGDKVFDQPPFEFTTEVKSPVILKIKASLKWKENFAGNYLLEVVGLLQQTIITVLLSDQGQSQVFEAKYLPPDLTYNFTLEKPYYKPKTITRAVSSGENELDFGELQPDISSAILNPKALWQILPFSNLRK